MIGFRAAVAAILALAASPLAAWEASTSKSPIDDSEIYRISVDADGQHEDKFGQRGRATLAIICEQNTTLLAIITPRLYMSDHGDWGYATFRVDSMPAERSRILAANDAGSIALRGGDAIKQIRSMIDGDQLFVRVLPVNENSKDLFFPIQGLAEAVAPIRTACGW